MAKNNSILLLGSYGRGNIGDDIFLEAAITLMPNSKIYINCTDEKLLPVAVRGKVTTVSTSMIADIPNKIKMFFSVGSIVYWGGDLWVLLYGSRLPRQALYKMLLLNMGIRLFRKRLYYVGVGIGDLRGYSLFLARLSARLASRVFVREKRTAKTLALANTEVIPDIAVNLNYYKRTLHKLPQKHRKFHIIFSALYHIPNPEVNFKIYKKGVADFVNSLDPKLFRITFLAMLTSESEPYNDIWAIKKIRTLIRNDMEVSVADITNIADLVDIVGKSDLVVGTRLHANIIAAYNAVPCIGIAYRPKVSSFFDDNGLDRYCIDINDIKKLFPLFMDVYSRYNEVAKEFHKVSKRVMNEQSGYKTIIKKITR